MKSSIIFLMALLMTAVTYSFSMHLDSQLFEAIDNRDINQVNQVNQLLKQGANVNAKNPEDLNRTPLHSAAFDANLALIKLFILAGADVDAQDDELNTPLHFTMRLHLNRHAKLLLEHGANPNIKNKRGLTPLHIARNEPESIKLLLSYGADVNTVDQNGKTPLDIFTDYSWKQPQWNDATQSTVYVTNERVIEIIKTLINGGAQVTKQFLRKAIQEAQPELVKLALEKGVYANQEDLDYAKQLSTQAANQEMLKQYEHIGRILVCYLNIAEPFNKLAKSPEGTFAQLPAEMQTEIARQFAQSC